MATFLPQVQTILPQVETFTPDYKFLQDVLDTRQDRYDTNYNALNDLYGKVVHADLSRDDNKAIRDQFSKDLTPKLEQISGLDLSLQQNVNTAKGLFKPFYDDKAMVKDIFFTRQYKRQMGYAQNLLNSPEEKERFKYSDWGVKDLQFQMQDFQAAERDASVNMANPTYTNNVNLVDMGVEALKELGMSIKKTTSDGKWLITQKNGSLLTNQLVGYEPEVDANGEPTGKLDNSKPIYASPAMEYLQERLIHDPAVARAYYVKNKTLARIEAEANAEQYGSYEKAQEAWAKGVLEKYGMEIPKELVKVNNMLESKTKQVKGWEAYKKEKGIIPGSPEEDMLLKSQFEQQLLQDAVDYKNKTYKDVGGPAANIQALLEKAYRAESAMQMNADMAKAAIAYSNIDYEETRVADPFALKKMDYEYSILKQKNQHLLDKQLARYKKSLEGETDTGLNYFAPGGDPNAAEVITDRNITERQKFDIIDRYGDQYATANENLTGYKIKFVEQVYNNLSAYNHQLSTNEGGSVLSSPGMVNYKAAVVDAEGNFLRYENVTKSWDKVMEDFTGPNLFYNQEEADRLFESAYKQAYGRDFETDDLSVPLPTDAELWRSTSPELQDGFNHARKLILAYQARMLYADKNFNSSLHAAYEKWNAEADQRDGGFRNPSKWSERDQKKYNKKLDKALEAEEKGNLGKAERKRRKATDNKSMDRSEHDWGMFPPILTDSQIKDIKNGKLWEDIIADGEEVTGISADDPRAGSLQMLSEDDYIKLLTANIIAQEEKILAEFNQYRDSGGKGRKYERNSDFLTKDKRDIFGLGKLIRYGTPDVPTYVGNFWKYNKSLGKMEVDHARIKDYASQYYQGVLTGMNAQMLSPTSASVDLPSDYQQLFNNTAGDGAADVIQHNVYGFTYNDLDRKSPKSQLAISELNNMFTMFNDKNGEWDVDLGAKGNQLPEDYVGFDFKRQRQDMIQKGNNRQDVKDYNAALQLLNQIKIDLATDPTSKTTTPQFQIEYRENIAGTDMGSYTLILGEEYAKKYKDKGLLEGNKEFSNSNAVTFYFKKQYDNSNYKTMNKSFDDIKVLTDINGTFNQEVTGGGQYWFTKNTDGMYVANIVLHKFDPESGQMILDNETKRQVVVDPSVTNLTNLANQLDNTLRQTAESNFGDQSIYKENYTGQ